MSTIPTTIQIEAEIRRRFRHQGPTYPLLAAAARFGYTLRQQGYVWISTRRYRDNGHLRATLMKLRRDGLLRKTKSAGAGIVSERQRAVFWAPDEKAQAIQLEWNSIINHARASTVVRNIVTDALELANDATTSQINSAFDNKSPPEAVALCEQIRSQIEQGGQIDARFPHFELRYVSANNKWSLTPVAMSMLSSIRT